MSGKEIARGLCERIVDALAMSGQVARLSWMAARWAFDNKILITKYYSDNRRETSRKDTIMQKVKIVLLLYIIQPNI